jgi:hypothetical protein
MDALESNPFFKSLHIKGDTIIAEIDQHIQYLPI